MGFYNILRYAFFVEPLEDRGLQVFVKTLEDRSFQFSIKGEII